MNFALDGDLSIHGTPEILTTLPTVVGIVGVIEYRNVVVETVQYGRVNRKRVGSARKKGGTDEYP